MIKLWTKLFEVYLRLRLRVIKLIILCLEAYIIKSHGLYNEKFYKEQREDLKKVKHGLIHFVRYGWKEKLSPCELFDVAYYLEKDKNIIYNPLIHYIKYGESEGRKPHPLFNPDYYRLHSKVNKNYLGHYLNCDGKYQPLLFPYQIVVNDTLIIDEDFYVFKEKEETVNEINLLITKGQLKDAIGKFYEIWDRKRALKLSRIRKYEYNILPARDYGHIVYKKEQREQLSEIESMNGYNSEYKYPVAYINRYTNVSVIGGTNLILKDNIIYNDELADFWNEDYGVKPWDVLEVKYNKNKLFGCIESQVLENRYSTIDKGILISCSHDNNYFHWMVESLPMLMYALDCMGDSLEYPLLIPEKLHNNYISALNCILSLYSDAKIIKLKSKCIYNVKELIVPSDLSRILDRYHGDELLGTDVVINPLYVKKVSRAVKKQPYPKRRKIYLSRAGGSYRKLINEEEIEVFLVRNGFEIVDLSKTSFEFQQELFAQAEVVVAPTGATMTNMLLSPAKSKFFVLYSNHPQLSPKYLNGKRCLLWDQLAQVCDVELTQINGERMHNREDLHDDYMIPIELLEKVLSERGAM